KAQGTLTKEISLTPDGSVKSDTDKCRMSEGTARRVRLGTMKLFGDLIWSTKQNQALAMGVLRADLPDQVQVVTKTRLAKLNGAAPPSTIARSQGYLAYRPGEPTVALLDFDRKGMQAPVASKLDAVGGFRRAICSVVPELEGVARVERVSTSA